MRLPLLRPLLLLALLFTSPLRAQEGAAGDVPADAPTPRSTLHAFLDAARRGDWNTGATFIASGPVPQRPELARQLAAVLDARSRLDPDALSDVPEGRLDDHLARDTEDVGAITVDGVVNRVRLRRLDNGRWVFTAVMLARVPAWYDGLEHRWLRERLPEPLLRVGWRGLFWWQWLALPFFVLVAAVVGQLVAVALRRLLLFIARRTTWTFDDQLVERLRGPSILLCATLAAGVASRWLAATEDGTSFVAAVLEALILLTVFWAALRTVDLAADAMRDSDFTRRRPETLGLLPIGTKGAKIGLAIVAIVTVLQRLGYPAASLIAGLGIGGLAFALAAQKTVENLFGSVTLGVDQPFRPGDYVNVEGLQGTVESVGLRSTRIRTPDRTLVTLPNGRLADMRIETFAPRDRFRFFTVLGVSYATTAAQLRAIVEDTRLLLATHPRRGEGDVAVALRGLGASSLEIEISCWFATVQGAEFNALRQEALLGIMEVVEKHGASLAFPTQTLHIASIPPPPEPPPEPRPAEPPPRPST